MPDERLAQELLGEVAGGDFAVGIADVQPGEHPGEAGGVEAFVAGEESVADPIQRIRLAAGCPTVVCCTRRRTSSDAALARRIT
jgi:hypothetical protein